MSKYYFGHITVRQNDTESIMEIPLLEYDDINYVEWIIVSAEDIRGGL